MSYSTVMAAVDLHEIARIVAEHDASALEAARNAHPHYFEADDDEPSRGAALASLIQGETSPDLVQQYGYALELLCQTQGEWLPDDDLIGDLEPLELKSPLEQWRSPIALPASPDWPRISYLTADEVQSEAARLASLDLAFPDDLDIEEAREAYAECIRTAASQRKAIVAFYR